jgi:hypothetical protein
MIMEPSRWIQLRLALQLQTTPPVGGGFFLVGIEHL